MREFPHSRFPPSPLDCFRGSIAYRAEVMYFEIWGFLLRIDAKLCCTSNAPILQTFMEAHIAESIFTRPIQPFPVPRFGHFPILKMTFGNSE